MEGTYRILIENGARRIEIESNEKEWVEKQKVELIKQLKLFETEAVRPESRAKEEVQLESNNGSVSIEKLTIMEFYRKYCTGIKTNPDKAVFFIYYLGSVENKKRVTTNDVRDLFVKVGIPKANTLNMADVLSKAKKRALLNYIDNGWSLTITGEDFVVNRLQKGKVAE